MRDSDIQILWLSGKTYETQYKITKHQHAFFQLQFFISGSEEIKINKEKMTMKRNQLILISPDTVHSYSFLQNSKVIDIKFNLSSDLSALIKDIFNKKITLIDPLLITLLQQLLDSAMTSPLEEHTQQLTLDTFLKLFLLQIYQEKKSSNLLTFCDDTLQNLVKDSKIKPLIIYLNSNYEKNITRLFRDEIQLTPNQNLQKIRLNQAAEMLKNSNYSIEYIANSVGLSFNYFSKSFKLFTGQTPTNYRLTKQQNFESIILSNDFDITMEP